MDRLVGELERRDEALRDAVEKATAIADSRREARRTAEFLRRKVSALEAEREDMAGSLEVMEGMVRELRHESRRLRREAQIAEAARAEADARSEAAEAMVATLRRRRGAEGGVALLESRRANAAGSPRVCPPSPMRHKLGSSPGEGAAPSTPTARAAMRLASESAMGVLFGKSPAPLPLSLQRSPDVEVRL